MAVPAIGFFGILYVSIAYVPVNKENLMLGEYHYVDKNYNEIMQQKMEFEKLYDAKFTFNSYGDDILTIRSNGSKVFFPYGFKMGENSFSFRLVDKKGNFVSKANVKLLLTRYDTNEFNQKLELASVENGVYTVKPFTIEKSGRWKTIVSVEVNDLKNIYEQKVFAK